MAQGCFATARMAVLLMIAITEVSAHGQLTVPRPRADTQGRTESSSQVEPVYTINGPRAQYTANSMRCHDFGPSAEKTTITAGTDLALTWTMEASHPGDCYVYMSYDGANPTNFFKIAQFLGCGAANGLNPPASVTETIRIPAELPPCEHCVMRWEWTSHQQVVNIEFYVQCVDVTVVSNAGPTKPTPITAISGIEHLPATASAYRNVYNTQPSEDQLVGPTLATFTTCTAGSAGCVGAAAVGTGATGTATNGGTTGGTAVTGTTSGTGATSNTAATTGTGGTGGTTGGTSTGTQGTVSGTAATTASSGTAATAGGATAVGTGATSGSRFGGVGVASGATHGESLHVWKFFCFVTMTVWLSQLLFA